MSCLQIRESINSIEELRSTLDTLPQSLPLVLRRSECPLRPTSHTVKVQRKIAVVRADSWLRTLGLYGSLIITSVPDSSAAIRVVIGFKLPSWMLHTSIDFKLEISRLSAQELGVRILPGEIRDQNWVSRESTFMTACANGDVGLMRQCLQEKSGSLRDKTACTGSTPLMVGKSYRSDYGCVLTLSALH